MDSQPSVPTEYDIGQIHSLLLAAFTPEELRRFCRDRPRFRPILDKFGPGQGKDDMVDRVIDYAESKGLLSELVAEIKKENPCQFDRFAEKLLEDPASAKDGTSPPPEDVEPRDRPSSLPAPTAGGISRQGIILPIAVVVGVALLVGLLLTLRSCVEPTATATATATSTATATLPPAPTDELEEDAAAWDVFLEGWPEWSIAKADMAGASGRALRCSIEGGEPYSNVHCFRHLQVDSSHNAFALSLSFWFSPTTTCNNEGGESIVQAIEVSVSRWQEDKRYEMAVQWENVGEGAPQWRYWAVDDWVPFDPAVRQTQCLDGERWHALRLEGKIANGQVDYQRLLVDELTWDLRRLSVPPAEAPGETPRVAIAVQVDGNRVPSPYHLFLDQVKFESWYVPPQPTLTPTPSPTNTPEPQPTSTPTPTSQPTPADCALARITVPKAGSEDVDGSTRIEWVPSKCLMDVQIYQNEKLLRENKEGDSSGSVDLSGASAGEVEIKIWEPRSSSPSDAISVTVR